MTEKHKLPLGVRETKIGVYFLGKDAGNGNTYFYTHETMGTAGDPSDSPNFLGDIRAGRIENPHSVSSVKYALSEESYIPKEIKAKIQAVIEYLQHK